MPFLVKTKLEQEVLDVIHRFCFAQVEFQRAGVSLSVSLLYFQNTVKVKCLKYVKYLAHNHDFFFCIKYILPSIISTFSAYGKWVIL